MSSTKRISVFVASIVLLSADAPSQPRPAPSHPFDLIHISLDLTIDYLDLTFKGIVINSVVPVDGVASIILHFGKNLDLQSCEVDGRKAVCIRDEDRLAVQPQGGFVAGKKTDILVRYSDHNHASNGGFHWVRPTWPEARHEGFWAGGGSNQARQWMPTWDEPDDFASTDQLVHVPADWLVVGNGQLVSDGLNDEKLDRPSRGGLSFIKRDGQAGRDFSSDSIDKSASGQ